MNRRFAIILIALLACMVPVAASAEPTITGPSGLLSNPTADIAPTGHAWFSLNFLDQDTFIMPDESTQGGTVWTALITGGITDNFEAGVGFSLQEEGDDGILVNAKFLVLEDSEEEWYPAIAVGGSLANFNGSTDTKLYAVASKWFWMDDSQLYGGSIHAGVDYRDANNLDFQFGTFVGADLGITEDLVGIAEWHDEDHDFFGNGFAYGVRYYFNDSATGQAGFIDGDLTIGGSYVF